MQVEFPKWDGGFNLHFLSQWRKKIEVATSGCSAMGSNPYPNRKETHKMVCLFSGSFKLNVYFELVLVAVKIEKHRAATVLGFVGSQSPVNSVFDPNVYCNLQVTKNYKFDALTIS